MAEEYSTPIATTSTDERRKTMARQLTGTSFLTLEHIAYFALVVLMPTFLIMAATTALNLWQNSGSVGSDTGASLNYLVGPMMHMIDTATAIGLCALFLVLVPLMYVLRRRTAAEYTKRPGYTGRVAYKLPVYTALGLLVAQAIGSVISMLGAFLNSLANIGVKNADIGAMYTEQFLPALLAFLVFSMAAWYVMWFAKGRDMSRMFVGAVTLLAAVMVIALFVTTLTLNHDTKSPESTSPTRSFFDAPDKDYYNY